MLRNRKLFHDRQLEAHKTIDSVFSRPRRRTKSKKQSVGLPNSLREILLQNNHVALVRVLDGLLLKGITECQPLTERMICEVLQGIVGRHSVRRALQACADGQAIFRADPSPKPPSQTAFATASADSSNNKCLLFRMTESNKSRCGRPATYYLMPKIADLCALFSVELKGGDTLQIDDCRSGRRYREALNRELFRRRPGRYTVEWLAKRLGISKRTCQRYHRQSQVIIDSTYHELSIDSGKLGLVPEQNPPPGSFLLDDRGKRYPALRIIAKKLLFKKRRVAYMQQQGNHYTHVDNFIALLHREQSSVTHPTKLAQKPSNSRFLPHLRLLINNPAKTAKKAVFERNYAIDAMTQSNDIQQKPNYSASYRQSVAQKLHHVTKNRAKNADGCFSLARAQQLVERYGCDFVEQAQQLLHKRRNIRKPGRLYHILRANDGSQS